MSDRWAEWEKAKRELKEDPSIKRSAVDDALSIVRQARRTSRRESDAVLRCPACDGVSFKTRRKGQEWECRACGKLLTKDSGGGAQ